MRIGIKYCNYSLLGIDRVYNLVDSNAQPYFIQCWIKTIGINEDLLELLAVVTNSYKTPQFNKTLIIRK